MTRQSFLVVCVLGVACSSGNATGVDASPDVPGMMEAGMDGSTSSCNAAIEQVLKPIDMVSTGDVAIVSESGGVRTLYIDASAGGPNVAEMNPRVYVDLSTAKRVDISDVQARTSTAWDLALRRYVMFTNGGTGGPGMGGSLVVGKAFDQVTAADAAGKTFAVEAFVDQDCNQNMDPLGGILTTMSDWYDYNQQTNTVTPKKNFTYIIRGASGKLFKLAILQFYGLPDGGTGSSGGHFIVQVGAL